MINRFGEIKPIFGKYTCQIVCLGEIIQRFYIVDSLYIEKAYSILLNIYYMGCNEFFFFISLMSPVTMAISYHTDCGW